jgi:CheY-like chemotaxis protein
VAKDNPLNSRLLETRLTRRGHAVKVAVEGKACVDAFKSTPQAFDIILMDIQVSVHLSAKHFERPNLRDFCDMIVHSVNHFQMPLVDGIDATRMIREFEKDPSSGVQLSPRVATYGRIPIAAVSASLSEERVHEYIYSGFDGWILKRIDFKRLEAILIAIEDEETRGILLYGNGNWDKGGWFNVKSEGWAENT